MTKKTRTKKNGEKDKKFWVEIRSIFFTQNPRGINTNEVHTLCTHAQYVRKGAGRVFLSFFFKFKDQNRTKTRMRGDAENDYKK